MTTKWYFSLNNEVYGPVSLQELVDLKTQGQITPESLVLRVGEEKWIQLKEEPALVTMGSEGTYLGARSVTAHSLETDQGLGVFSLDFSNELPSIGSELEEKTATFSLEDNQNAWVVLKKVEEEEGKFKFLQDGPFSTKEVLDKIQKGELRYSDHCWREGLSDWIALRDEPAFVHSADVLDKSELADLAPHEDSSPEISMPSSEELEDLPGSVHFGSTELGYRVTGEPSPPEADGSDLASLEKEDEEGDRSFVFDPTRSFDKSSSMNKPPAFVSEEDTADIQLENFDPSVTKGAASVRLPEAPLPQKPITDNSYSSASKKVLDQPHIRRKLLEVEMRQRRSEPPQWGYKFLILLVGALVLLMFGLHLAKDLNP